MILALQMRSRESKPAELRMRSATRQIPLLVTLVLVILFGLTAARSVQGFDSGEAVAAAYSWGVPHPPGFPVFILLSGAFIRILPVAPELAVSLLSAVAGAVAAGLLCSLLLSMGVGRVAAVLACGAWALMSESWALHTGQEPFAASHCAVAALLWFSFHHYQRPRLILAFGLGVASGLAVGVHPIAVMAAPPIAVALYADIRQTPAATTLKRTALFVTGIIVGLLPNLYLVYAARGSGQPQWNHVTTFGALFDHMLRREYGTLSLALGKQGSFGATLMGYCAHTARSGVGLWPVLIIAGLGVVLLRKATKQRIYLVSIAGSFLLSSVIFLSIFKTPDTTWWNAITARFFPNADLYASILVGVGIDALTLSLPRLKTVGVTLLIAWTLSIATLAISRGPSAGRDVFATYANDVLDSVLPNAILIGHGDDDASALWDAQIARKLRPDVTFVLQPLLPVPWYAESIVKPTNGYLQPARMAGIRLLIEHAFRVGRPVYAMGSVAPAIANMTTLTPEGVVTRILPRQQSISPLAIIEGRELDFYAHHPFPTLPSIYDPRVGELMIFSRYQAPWISLGTQYRQARDTEGAERCFARATAIATINQLSDQE